MNAQRLVAAIAALAIGFAITLVGVSVNDDESSVVMNDDGQDVGALDEGSGDAEQREELAEPTPAAQAPDTVGAEGEIDDPAAVEPEVGEQSETSATRPAATTTESTQAPRPSATTSGTLECATTLIVAIPGDTRPRDLLVEQVFAEGFSGVSETGEYFTVFEPASSGNGGSGDAELFLGDRAGNAEERITSVEVVKRFVRIEFDDDGGYVSIAFSDECDEAVGEFIADDEPSTSTLAFFMPCRADLRPSFEAVVASTPAEQFLVNVEGVTSFDELTDTEIVTYAIAGVLQGIGRRGVDTYVDELDARSGGLGRFDQNCPAALADVDDRFDDARSVLCLAAQLAEDEGAVEYLTSLAVVGDECSYDAIRIDVDDQQGDG